MYDERVYMSCRQCSAVFRRDDAVRHPDLFGGFCSERCALTFLTVNNPPRHVDRQVQAGDNHTETAQILHFDDLNPWVTRGGQYE